MQEFMGQYFEWFKTLHIISVITWMAALFYLPRLFVYHAVEEVGSATSETFKVMERKLQRGIMTPSMVVVFATGIPMATQVGFGEGWMHIKLLLVLLMAACHFFYSQWRLDFLHDRNTRPHKFYRYANEAPTVLLILIVILVVTKPF